MQYAQKSKDSQISLTRETGQKINESEIKTILVKMKSPKISLKVVKAGFNNALSGNDVRKTYVV